MRLILIQEKGVRGGGKWRELRYNSGRATATFEPKKRRHLACPHCGTVAKHKCLGARSHQALHQISNTGARFYVDVKQPFIHCSHCGKKSVCHPSWLKTGKRYTESFRAIIFYLCRHMSCNAVANLCQMDPKTVRRIDMEILQATLQSTDLSQTKRLLVDEKRIAKKRFVTIVLDGDSHELLYLAEGRKSETLARFLRSLPDPIKQQIKAVAMDGSRAYQVAVKRELPAAMVCLDRFHLYRDINQMVRLAFKEIAGSEAGQAQRQTIRRIANLTSQDSLEAEALLAELSAAHQLNAELIALVKLFKSAWQQPTFHEAAACLQGFVRVASHSNIQAVKNFAARIAEQADYIANAIALRISNGPMESFNRKIADLIRRGCGYLNLEYLALKIRQLSIPQISIPDFMAGLYTKSP